MRCMVHTCEKHNKSIDSCHIADKTAWMTCWNDMSLGAAGGGDMLNAPPAYTNTHTLSNIELSIVLCTTATWPHRRATCSLDNTHFAAHTSVFVCFCSFIFSWWRTYIPPPPTHSHRQTFPQSLSCSSTSTTESCFSARCR